MVPEPQRRQTPLASESMNRARLAQVLRTLLRPETTYPMPAPSIREVALRFRAYCAEFGPEEIAAAVGAPSALSTDDLRTVAYLFAARVSPDAARELCVEQGIFGFQEWLARHE